MITNVILAATTTIPPYDPPTTTTFPSVTTTPAMGAFWRESGSILTDCFTFLTTTTFLGIPLYVILLGVAVIGAIFGLLSNKKKSGGE